MDIMRVFLIAVSLILLAILTSCTPKFNSPILRDWESHSAVISFTEDSTVLINGDSSGTFSMDTIDNITISFDGDAPVEYNYSLSESYLFLDVIQNDSELKDNRSRVFITSGDSMQLKSDSTNILFNTTWVNGSEKIHFRDSTKLTINDDITANYYTIGSDSLLLFTNTFSGLYRYNISNGVISIIGTNDNIERFFLGEGVHTNSIIDSNTIGLWLNRGKNKLVLNSDFTAEAQVIDTITNEIVSNKSGTFILHSSSIIEIDLQGRSVLYSYNIEDSTLFLSKVNNLKYNEQSNTFRFDKMAILKEPTVVDSILSTLTLYEKIGQMIIVYHAPLSFLQRYNIGGTLIMRNMIANESAFSESIKEIQEKMSIPIITSIDQEGGKVNRLVRKPQFADAPSAEELSGWSYNESYEYHQNVAAKLTELGINLNLAPVLDPELNSHNRPTFMKNEGRSYSSDGDSALTAFITAFTDANIGTTSKHFPGYDAAVNSDHDIAISDADSSQLELYLSKFRQFADQYQAIMMSSILYSNISDKPAVFSRPLVDLAKSIDSTAVIVTDDLWGAALRAYVYDGPNMSNSSYPDSAFAKVITLAFEAGNDMLMVTFPQKVPLMIETIKESVARDETYEDHIDESVRRILNLKLELGLISDNSEE